MHPFAHILQARSSAIACGDEDADDLDRLRSDPAATFGDRRVVAGDAQPAAQPHQHFVAEKAQLVCHC